MITGTTSIYKTLLPTYNFDLEKINKLVYIAVTVILIDLFIILHSSTTFKVLSYIKLKFRSVFSIVCRKFLNDYLRT